MTSPGLTVTLTNLGAPDQQVPLNVTGPITETVLENGKVQRVMGGRNLFFDGTKAVSTWSPTLQRWATAVAPPLGQTCPGRLTPKIPQWEGRCR